MRWQHVPNLWCRYAETARTITRGPSARYIHVIVVSRAKPRTKGNGDDQWTEIAEVHCWSAMDTVACHQRNFERNALRHGQPVKCVAQCWRDVVTCDMQPTAVIVAAAALMMWWWVSRLRHRIQHDVLITRASVFFAANFAKFRGAMCEIPPRNSAALLFPNTLHSAASRRRCINWQHFKIKGIYCNM